MRQCWPSFSIRPVSFCILCTTVAPRIIIVQICITICRACLGALFCPSLMAEVGHVLCLSLFINRVWKPVVFQNPSHHLHQLMFSNWHVPQTVQSLNSADAHLSFRNPVSFTQSKLSWLKWIGPLILQLAEVQECSLSDLSGMRELEIPPSGTSEACSLDNTPVQNQDQHTFPNHLSDAPLRL